VNCGDKRQRKKDQTEDGRSQTKKQPSFMFGTPEGELRFHAGEELDNSLK